MSLQPICSEQAEQDCFSWAQTWEVQLWGVERSLPALPLELLPGVPPHPRAEQGNSPAAGAHSSVEPVGSREGSHSILKLRWVQFLACCSGLVWPGASGHLAGPASPKGKALVGGGWHVWGITGLYFRFLGRGAWVGLLVKRRDTEEIWGRRRTE